MINIVFVIIGIIIGFILGWICCYRANGVGEYEYEEYEEYLVYQDPETGEEIEITKSIHLLIEKENGCFYAYNAETSEYIAKGQTKSILNKNINDRHPNAIFTVDNTNLEDVGL